MTENEEIPATQEEDVDNTEDEQNSLTPHQQFLEMLPEDLREDPTFSPYKGESVNEIIGKLAKSHVNVNKLVGADKGAVLKIPSSPDDQEGWNAVYSKLGRPDTVEGYEVDKYKDVEGADLEQLKGLADIAYKRGVSKEAFSEIVDTYYQQMSGFHEESQKQLEQAQADYEAQLRREWGDAYETKAKKIVSTLEQNAADGFKELVASMPFIVDHPAFVKTIDNIIKLSAEDGAPSSANTSSEAPMTPTEAKAAIAALSMDAEKQKILMSSGDPRRDSIIAERERLFKYAYPKG